MHVPGGKRTLLIMGLLVLVAAWIGSGVILREEIPHEPEPEPVERRMTVAVRISEAQPVERLLVMHGDLQPEQILRVRAQTGGEVKQWRVPLGAVVDAGDLLARLDLDERLSQRRQAQARLNVAKHQLRATRQLVEEGYEPKIRLESAQAELEGVQAELAAIEEDIRRTRIRTLIPGRVDQRIAEEGDFVSVGGEVARIVNNDPLRAIIQVPQHSIGQVEAGQQARVNIFGHGLVEGQVTFVSSLSDPATRTFRVEVKVPNPDQRLPAGTSTEVVIPTEEVPAHKVSPAIIGLDDKGRVGVKTVDGEHRVQFHVIEFVRAERDGVWVGGLPERARIITVGQGFVRPGDEVIPQPEETESGE